MENVSIPRSTDAGGLSNSSTQRRFCGSIDPISCPGWWLRCEREITRDLDRVPMDWRAREGYDPVLGARPRKRVIQPALENLRAGLGLKSAVREGETIHVSADSSGLVINGRLAEAA